MGSCFTASSLQILASSSSSSSSSLASSTESTKNCQPFIDRLDKCIRKRGERSERCCIPHLELRRCVSFEVCPNEAREYYYAGGIGTGIGGAARERTGHSGGDGETSSSSSDSSNDRNNPPTSNDIDPTLKSQCAAFQEVTCYGNPRIMNVDGSSTSSQRKNRSEKAIEKERIFIEHEKAKRRMTNNRMKHRACADVTDKLSRCLRKHGYDMT